MIQWFRNRFGKKSQTFPEKLKVDKRSIKGSYVDLKHELITDFGAYFQIEFTETDQGLHVVIFGNHQSVELRHFITYLDRHRFKISNVVLTKGEGFTIRIICNQIK
jgi:hypothetical protein